MTSKTAQTTNDPKAHRELQRAHDTGYRYAPEFGGFRARIVSVQDGTTCSGTIEISAPREVTITLEADEEQVGWIRREIGSMAGHRWYVPYSEADGRHSLSIESDESHPLGRLITVHDDRFNSSYRVRDGQITQVNRQMGPIRFSILMQERTVTDDGRALPANFTVMHWNLETGRLVRAETYIDRYLAVEGVWLPASRQVVSADDDGLTVRRLELTGHELLPATIAVAEAPNQFSSQAG